MDIGSVSSSRSSTQYKSPINVKEVTKAIQQSETKTTQEPFQQQHGKTDELTKKKLQDIVQGMNDFLTPTQTSLKFLLHDDLREYYVTVIDESTKEVIREIPSKKLLDMYAAMKEFLGLVVDRKI